MLFELVSLWICASISYYIFSVYGLPYMSKRRTESKDEICIGCGTILLDILHKVCFICEHRVCRQCAIWNTSKNSYTCLHCHAPIKAESAFWYGEITGKGVSNSEDVSRARSEVEKLIEETATEGIDQVSLGKLFENPEYERIFHEHHTSLSDCIFDIFIAFHAGNNISTEKKTRLNDLLGEIRNKAGDLPKMEMNGVVVFKTSQNPTYEDVLATAVINKLVCDSVDSAIQTDSDFEKKEDLLQWVKKSNQGVAVSDDDLISTNSSNWSNSGDNKQQVNERVVIEEVEEITTTTYDEMSDIEDDETLPHRVRLSRKGRNKKRDERPEDLMDGLLVQEIAAWEQNWLFKRRKQLFRKRNLLNEGVSMLVPNPNELVEPLVGNEKASDLSDLEDNTNMEDVSQSEDESDEELRQNSDDEAHVDGKGDEVSKEEIKHVMKTEIIGPLVNTINTQIVETDEQESQSSAPQDKLEFELVNSDSEQSSVEETLRETTHSLTRNSTVEKEIVMSIAQREKMKWANPVSIENNPYAKENLEKRIRSRDYTTMGISSLHVDVSLTSDEEFKPSTQDLKKFSRDYYIGGKSLPASDILKPPKFDLSRGDSSVKSIDSGNVSELEDIQLPSVKKLAMQFNSSAEPVHSDIPHQPSPIKMTTAQQQLVKDDDEQLPPPLPNSPPPLPKTPPPKKFSSIDLSLSYDQSDSGKMDEELLNVVDSDSLLFVGEPVELIETPANVVSDIDNDLIHWDVDVVPEINNDTEMKDSEQLVGVSAEVSNEYGQEVRPVKFSRNSSWKEDRKLRSKSLISLDEWRVLKNELREKEIDDPVSEIIGESKVEEIPNFEPDLKKWSEEPTTKFGYEKSQTTDDLPKHKFSAPSSKSVSTFVPDIKEARMQTIDRTKSLPRMRSMDTERRLTAMEVLATPPMFKPKEEEDLIKLRNQIVRASRSRKALPKANTLK